MFLLAEAGKRVTSMSAADHARVEKRLQHAETAFLCDSNPWGLGLTYNLWGRIYTNKKYFNYD